VKIHIIVHRKSGLRINIFRALIINKKKEEASSDISDGA
jgi:hypothetical protein